MKQVSYDRDRILQLALDSYRGQHGSVNLPAGDAGTKALLRRAKKLRKFLEVEVPEKDLNAKEGPGTFTALTPVDPNQSDGTEEVVSRGSGDPIDAQALTAEVIEASQEAQDAAYRKAEKDTFKAILSLADGYSEEDSFSVGQISEKIKQLAERRNVSLR